MQEITFLSNKEVKPIFASLKSQWGFDERVDWAFVLTSKNRVYIINRDVSRIDLSKVRINSIGLYFGEWKREELRLSVEGAQLIGPQAKKNVVELDGEERKQWLQGIDIDKAGDAQGFVIIRNGRDFLGCGRCKEGRILNFVPKARRLLTSDLPSE